jgi:selenocysteine lyase/cysteine desulfurase
MEIKELRASIPATREVAYFNTGWAGPSPQPVVDRMKEVFDRECAVGPASLEAQRLAREVNESARVAVAGLFAAPPDEVMITHGTTEGLHVVLYGFPWQPGDELVTCALEHAALAQSANTLEQKFGIVAKRVEVPPDASEEQQLRLVTDAITPRTRMVALSHVQYTCGLRMPISAIVEAAHRAGALVVVDGAQTGGQLALDVREIGADFYSISGQKWALGPQGTGALWVAPEHNRTFEPIFNTHDLADRRGGPALEGAGPPNPLQRFRLTSNSTALIAGFGEAARLLTSVGMEAIEERASELADRLRVGVAALSGARVTGPLEGGTTCGLAAVALEGWEPRQVVESLWDRWRISIRAVNNPPAVRFSVHAFNTEGEVDKALDALGTLVKEEPPVAAAGAH